MGGHPETDLALRVLLEWNDHSRDGRQDEDLGSVLREQRLHKREAEGARGGGVPFDVG